jgi:CRISPR-associated protein Csc2
MAAEGSKVDITAEPSSMELNEDEKALVRTFRDKIYAYIPNHLFVDALGKNQLGHMRIAIVRETVGPFICRSTDPEASITLRMTVDREVIEVPARKFKAPEKLLGLKICREMNVVNANVRYNVLKEPIHLANPNSVLFGDSVTVENEAASLPSRARYDWSYSLRHFLDITDNLQHNALSESGTMWDPDTGEFRQSLFTVQYVLPGSLFPHFVTLLNVTPELLVHFLTCVLSANSYGAQTAASNSNFRNHIVAIGWFGFEAPLTPFTISRDWKADDQVDLKSVKNKMVSLMGGYYRKSLIVDGVSQLDGTKEKESGPSQGQPADNPSDSNPGARTLTELIKNVEDLWNVEEKETLKAIYKQAYADSQRYLEHLKIKEAAKGKSRERGRAKKN